MISQVSKFKLVNRGFDKTLTLVPGWASDWRVFGALDLDYNYLLPVELSPLNFERDLSEALNKEGIDKFSLFGWSMGGFLASDFASKNPDKIEELILVSVRKKYPGELLEDIKAKLKQNKRAFLYKLYFNCFSREDEEGQEWFKEHLLMDYINELRLDDLLAGLDYLRGAQIIPPSLSGVGKIRIFHGDDDKIASPDEARRLKDELPQAEFILLAQIGHTPFINKIFKEKFARING